MNQAGHSNTFAAPAPFLHLNKNLAKLGESAARSGARSEVWALSASWDWWKDHDINWMKVDMRVAADDDLELIIIIITIDSPARGGVTAIILYFDIGATVGTLLTSTD